MTDPSSENLIRAYIDGELEPDERAMFERRLLTEPDLQRQVEYETALRDRVAQVMGQATAPTALVDRLRSAIAEAASDSETPAAPETTTTRAAVGRPPVRVNVFAVAACLAIVAGAVLFGVFGPRLDDRRSDVGDARMSVATLFAATEHGRCGSAAIRDAKARWSDANEAEQRLSAYLDATVRVPDLSTIGYSFLGAGPCGMPSVDRSGHMIFVREQKDRPPAMASLFLVPNEAQFAEVGTSAHGWIEAGHATECGRPVYACTDGRLVYFLVCCDPSDLDEVAMGCWRTPGSLGDR